MLKDFSNKTAFITGGASGLGLSMGRAFGELGANVMLADIDADALDAARSHLTELGIKTRTVICDVTSRPSVEAAARQTVQDFGKVHIVCNNAGVGAGGAIGQIKASDWDWVIDVNLKGPVYGVETFVPLIMSHGEGGHIVNTSSMAALVGPPTMEPYCGTKAAVLSMSEGWAGQLAPRGIGVSVLLPGAVKTGIHDSWRHKPQQYGLVEPTPTNAIMSHGDSEAIILNGIDPDIVGKRVAEAILAGELYIFTHPETKDMTEARQRAILSAYDKADQSRHR